MREAGAYVHIPFCEAKCGYCDFLSFPASPSVGGDMRGAYAAALAEEIGGFRAARIPGHPEIPAISTVYVGGGTPSCLSARDLSTVLRAVAGLPLKPGFAEFTVEANPGTITDEKLALMRACGANRLSIGLQSCIDSELRTLGRAHRFAQFLEGYGKAREAGFGSVNVDLMFGIPGQTARNFRESLETVLALGPEHVSFYSLTPCEGTPLWESLESGELAMPDDETDRNMYALACQMLAGAGYFHYEISNAAKPGFECRHNMDCWLRRPYFGFGLGAHSFDGDGMRWSNPEDFVGYFAKEKPRPERLSRAGAVSEAMFLGLRLLSGVDEAGFLARYGVSPMSRFGPKIERLAGSGLIARAGGRIRLTPAGLDLANRVFAEFLESGE